MAYFVRFRISEIAKSAFHSSKIKNSSDYFYLSCLNWLRSLKIKNCRLFLDWWILNHFGFLEHFEKIQKSILEHFSKKNQEGILENFSKRIQKSILEHFIKNQKGRNSSKFVKEQNLTYFFILFNKKILYFKPNFLWFFFKIMVASENFDSADHILKVYIVKIALK